MRLRPTSQPRSLSGLLQAWVLLFGAGFLSSSCASRSSGTAPDPFAIPKGKTFADSGDYILDTGDTVALVVSSKQDISGTYKVSPSGYMAVPLAGMVRAKGLTEMQLRDALILKLNPHLSSPRVAVTVTESHSYGAYILGRVAKPGYYKLEGKTTLLQVMALAGGLLNDDAKRLIILREGADGQRRRYPISLKLVLDGQGQADSFIVERNDILWLE